MRKMDLKNTGDLAELQNEILRHKQHIEAQEALISVLEHDGHDVAQQEAALRVDRARLAVKIAQQMRLMGNAVS